MKRIYISGKMRNLENYELVFKEKEKELLKRFKEVINPVYIIEAVGRGFDGTVYFKSLLPALKKCTHIYMMKGWETSSGCYIEHEFAKALGIKIIYEGWELKDKLEYTRKHRKVFIQTEQEMFGKVTISSYFHDLDKLFLYRIFPDGLVQKIHRFISSHHIEFLGMNGKLTNWKKAIIDWECARKTKEDKPLDWKETLNKYYEKHKDSIYSYLRKIKRSDLI